MEVNNLLNNFLDFERENNLFNWQVNGIPVWELIRLRVFNKIDPAYTDSIKTTDRKFKKIVVGCKFFILNFFYRNPFKIKKQVDTIVINHPRRKFNYNAGCYEDIYTDTFLNELASKTNYIVLENYFQLNHFLPASTKKMFYLDKINFLIPFIKLYRKTKLKPIELSRIKEVEDKLKKKFNVEFDLEKLIIKEISVYHYVYESLSILFSRLQPKRLIVVVSYIGINQIACLVAKKFNVKVYELQHGTVGKYHIGYNYPREVNVKFFPESFISWGLFWTEKARMPFHCNIILAGFPYINMQKNLLDKNKKRRNQVLVISQMTSDVAYLALELSTLFSLRVLFKPHPREYSEIESKYKFLRGIENIEILDNPKINIYDYYNTSEYVIGSSSTALIEAASFGAKIIVMKFPGWEYFDDLQGENIFFAINAKEVAEVISNNNSNSNNNNLKLDDNFFFIKKSNEEFVSLLMS